MTTAMRVPNSSAVDGVTGARPELVLNLRDGDVYRQESRAESRSCATSLERVVASKRTSPNHWLSGFSTVEKMARLASRAHRNQSSRRAVTTGRVAARI